MRIINWSKTLFGVVAVTLATSTVRADMLINVGDDHLVRVDPKMYSDVQATTESNPAGVISVQVMTEGIRVVGEMAGKATLIVTGKEIQTGADLHVQMLVVVLAPTPQVGGLVRGITLEEGSPREIQREKIVSPAMILEEEESRWFEIEPSVSRRSSSEDTSVARASFGHNRVTIHAGKKGRTLVRLKYSVIRYGIGLAPGGKSAALADNREIDWDIPVEVLEKLPDFPDDSEETRPAGTEGGVRPGKQAGGALGEPETNAETPRELSLEEIRRRLARFRVLFEKLLRQPMLAGAGEPLEELLTSAKRFKDRWGPLADQIRTGRPSKELSPEGAKIIGGSSGAKLTGSQWADLSNKYFEEIHAIESRVQRRNDQLGNSPAVTALRKLIEQAEQRLGWVEARASEPDASSWRTELIQMLKNIYRAGQELTSKPVGLNEAGARPLKGFLRMMDGARELRHRQLQRMPALDQPGDSARPVPHEALLKPENPGLVIRAPAGASLQASTDDSESAPVKIDAGPPSRLPELAADLYHAHYLLGNVERFVAQRDNEEMQFIERNVPAADREKRGAAFLKGAAGRTEALRSRYEVHRDRFYHLMKDEADRVLPTLK